MNINYLWVLRSIYLVRYFTSFNRVKEGVRFHHLTWTLIPKGLSSTMFLYYFKRVDYHLKPFFKGPNLIGFVSSAPEILCLSRVRCVSPTGLILNTSFGLWMWIRSPKNNHTEPDLMLDINIYQFIFLSIYFPNKNDIQPEQ